MDFYLFVCIYTEESTNAFRCLTENDFIPCVLLRYLYYLLVITKVIN